MKVLVTGVSGQVGAAVARALVARGDAVRGLVRDPARAPALPGVSLTAGDLSQPEALAAAVKGVEAVVHCAGVVSFAPARADEQRAVNVEGTRALLHAAAAAGCRRFLLTSSIAAGGPVDGPGEGDEDSPFTLEGQGFVYGETKRQAEQLVLQDARLEGLAVRPGVILGAGDVNGNGGRMLLDLLAGKVPGVPSGATTLCNLDDVVAGHLAALDRGAAGRCWILGGTPCTFREAYQRIAAVLGVAPPRFVLPDWLVFVVAHMRAMRAGAGEASLTPVLARLITRNRRFSSARAIAELGYAPQPIEQGIAAAADWYVAQGQMAPKGAR
jgi:dihydroflavonol-4-reductase